MAEYIDMDELQEQAFNLQRRILLEVRPEYIQRERELVLQSASSILTRSGRRKRKEANKELNTLWEAFEEEPLVQQLHNLQRQCAHKPGAKGRCLICYKEPFVIFGSYGV